MKAVFDSTFAILMVDPVAKASDGPAGTRSGDARERIDYLIDTLDKQSAEIMIPTPVLAELLIRATPTLTEILALLQTTRGFRFLPFDYKAAVECGALLRGRRTGGKRNNASWSKVKFDHQIVAIARAEGADVIYSDDGDIKTLGAAVAIEVKGIWDLPPKPVEAQGKLPLP